MIETNAQQIASALERDLGKVDGARYARRIAQTSENGAIARAYAEAADVLEGKAVEPEYFIPTRAQVEAVGVGDLMPNCFGTLKEVVTVRYRGDDTEGKAYVGVMLDNGPAQRSASHTKRAGCIARFRCRSHTPRTNSM
ncbi:MAG: hypothetical protein AB7U82_27945 [Blastocatellales bacterium]